MKYLKGFLINLQFFTVILVPFELPMDKKHLNNAVKTFPLLGLFQGVVYAALLYTLNQWTPFSTLAIAFALWVTTILLTGGIHLDGWMDTCDAYFSFRSIDKRLDIMDDPRTGAFGVLSIILLLSARFLFIYEISMNLSITSYLLIVLIPLFSKSMMGILLLTVKPAKDEGLGALFRNATGMTTLTIYPVYLFVAILFLSLVEDKVILPIILFIAVTVGCYLFFKKKTVRWFNGITGDVLGASVEGVELMLWMTLWLLHYFAMG
ncbi:adenosylcobinamide-GDP ribazoletransferase [Alkalihalobacillus sp. AL-G]|uniref:adenosylcobinamide-GDP ribazoletransferase n=1 Tax=Alkalihalobacillus sp. AL-G TaxID=2926399 RepID=UPI00272B4834|nr:adenosylcobinamide-GDP ribazoletransferase [Alkalihalobacillus sp. AL-G]WLD91664.1 adenosylcobinamide-GDP ribazoletransferase [Alkalihalobacillus sp. AL-G]